jgi:hypothetical protein
MDAKHYRLTPQQADETREGYRRLLQLSKDRHEFGRLARRIGWCPKAVKEMWDVKVSEETKK